MRALIRDVFVGEDRVYSRANATEFDKKYVAQKNSRAARGRDFLFSFSNRKVDELHTQ